MRYNNSKWEMHICIMWSARTQEEVGTRFKEKGLSVFPLHTANKWNGRGGGVNKSANTFID